MLRLTAFLGALLFAATAVAATPVIDYLTPDHYKAKSAEHFLTIRGNALFVPPAVTTVLFSGGAGTFELTANAQSYTALTVWVPQEIVNRIGRYTVRVRVKDATKTLESNSAELEIIGNPGPVLDLPTSNIIKQATSKAGAVAEFTVSASSMVDGSPRPVTCDHNSGDTYPIGTTTVRCSATDSTGVMTEGQFSIIVVDFTGPTVHVPADILKEATSPKGAVVEFTVTAEDAVDGPLDPRCMPASGSLFPIGTTIVRCDPVDTHHNSGHGELRITIVEAHPHPILKLPDPITAEASGPHGAEVKYDASAEPGSMDETGRITSFVCTPASGSLFPLGTTTVSCTATDAQGASTTGTFTVTIVDTTPPVLTLPRDIETNDHVVTYIATATDLVDGDTMVDCHPPSGSAFSSGTTTVNCAAADMHGNTAHGSFHVTVRDRGTILHLPLSITIEATGPGGATVTFVATAEPEAAVSCSPASGSLFPLGMTTVNCSANGTTDSFAVTIVDTTPPSLTLPADITTNDPIVIFTASAHDIVDGNAGVICTPPSGSMFATGTAAVNCSAIDAHGNAAHGTFHVTVISNADTTPPVVTSISATPNVLDPPNHKLIPVTVAISVFDEIDPNPVSRIIGVTGSEQLDPSDWRITGPLTVELRAERTGQEEERIYTIHVATSDAAGNTTPSIVTVRVPHDNSSAGATPEPSPPRRRAAGGH
jgi:hypothetical protein